MLSDKDIIEGLMHKQIYIEPFNEANVQPASYDCTLDATFMRIKPSNETVLFYTDADYETVVADDEIVIEPWEFLLASTKEYIGLSSSLTAFVEGRSSIGRMGLFIENAGWVDPGFQGTITLELFNATKNYVRLPVGMSICQLVFARTNSTAFKPYAGKYSGQDSTTPSRIGIEFMKG